MIKTIFNPQTIYDGILLGFNYMPTKPAAVATAVITSSVVLYVMQPESMFDQVNLILLSSGVAWATTEMTHCIAYKLLQERLVQLEAEHKRNEARKVNF